MNKPPKGRENEGAPDTAGFSNQGQLCMAEFLKDGDVVCLMGCHRLDDKGAPGWSPGRLAQYRADATRFKDVLSRMADLEWTREDRDWLAQRDLGSLLSTPEGRDTYERGFKNAPILMDGRKTNRHGDDGADQHNEERLREVAAEQGVPILAIPALHNHPRGVDARNMDDADFQGLKPICGFAKTRASS